MGWQGGLLKEAKETFRRDLNEGGIKSREDGWEEFSQQSDQINGNCKGVRVVCLKESRRSVGQSRVRRDRKSTRLNSSHEIPSRMPSSA